MSSKWIYIDASGRVDDRSWRGDNAGLAEATQQIVPKLHRNSDTITATHDRYESEPIRSVITFTVSRSNGPDYYAGKLLLVPGWVANALIWPRVQAPQAPSIGSDAELYAMAAQDALSTCPECGLTRTKACDDGYCCA